MPEPALVGSKYNVMCYVGYAAVTIWVWGWSLRSAALTSSPANSNKWLQMKSFQVFLICLSHRWRTHTTQSVQPVTHVCMLMLSMLSWVHAPACGSVNSSSLGSGGDVRWSLHPMSCLITLRSECRSLQRLWLNMACHYYSLSLSEEPPQLSADSPETAAASSPLCDVKFSSDVQMKILPVAAFSCGLLVSEFWCQI